MNESGADEEFVVVDAHGESRIALFAVRAPAVESMVDEIQPKPTKSASSNSLSSEISAETITITDEHEVQDDDLSREGAPEFPNHETLNYLDAAQINSGEESENEEETGVSLSKCASSISLYGSEAASTTMENAPLEPMVDELRDSAIRTLVDSQSLLSSCHMSCIQSDESHESLGTDKLTQKFVPVVSDHEPYQEADLLQDDLQDKTFTYCEDRVCEIKRVISELCNRLQCDRIAVIFTRFLASPNKYLPAPQFLAPFPSAGHVLLLLSFGLCTLVVILYFVTFAVTSMCSLPVTSTGVVNHRIVQNFDWDLEVDTAIGIEQIYAPKAIEIEEDEGEEDVPRLDSLSWDLFWVLSQHSGTCDMDEYAMQNCTLIGESCNAEEDILCIHNAEELLKEQAVSHSADPESTLDFFRTVRSPVETVMWAEMERVLSLDDDLLNKAKRGAQWFAHKFDFLPAQQEANSHKADAWSGVLQKKISGWLPSLHKANEQIIESYIEEEDEEDTAPCLTIDKEPEEDEDEKVQGQLVLVSDVKSLDPVHALTSMFEAATEKLWTSIEGFVGDLAHRLELFLLQNVKYLIKGVMHCAYRMGYEIEVDQVLSAVQDMWEHLKRTHRVVNMDEAFEEDNDYDTETIVMNNSW